MNNRAYAIDVLRCLAIVGMVFSAQISWLQGLPAWMFHAQVPPPEFSFNPSLPGITWVDLVFPFFLFSMGAAFPLALRRKLEKGITIGRIIFDVVKRGLLLVLFAIALGNTSAYALSDISSPEVRAVMMIVTWFLFSCMFIRLPRLSERKNTYLNIAGVVMMIGWLLVFKYRFGVAVSLSKNDIIILILSNVAVVGSILWWLTRDNFLIRIGIIMCLVAMKISAAEADSWIAKVWNWSPAPWLFQMDFLKYLCIVLPGSMVGDMVWKWMKNKDSYLHSSRPLMTYVATGLVGMIFIVNIWGLFTRQLFLNWMLTLVLGVSALYFFSCGKSSTDRLHYRIFCLGYFCLLLGLLFEPYEGGIKKDDATLSYFFVTSGLASLGIVIISVLLNYVRINMNLLIRCGQNPMIAYTVAGYVVLPLLTVLHLSFVLQWMVEMGPVMGLLKGLGITGLMMWITWWFTYRRLFWKT